MPEKVDKAAMAKVTSVSTTIDIDGKYGWAINNADMDATKDLKPTGIKKY